MTFIKLIKKSAASTSTVGPLLFTTDMRTCASIRRTAKLDA